MYLFFVALLATGNFSHQEVGVPVIASPIVSDASTTMAKEGAQDRSDWQTSPQPEDSITSPEHLALVDFAQRLGSVTTNDEPGIADAV